MASTLAALVTRLEGLGLGTGGTDLFYGSSAKVPDGNGPITTLREVPGLPPHGIHDGTGTDYRRPFVQVIVRGARENYTAVETLATAIYAALSFVDVTVGGVRFLKCRPQQEPFDFGLDGTNSRVRIGFNVAIERHES